MKTCFFFWGRFISARNFESACVHKHCWLELHHYLHFRLLQRKLHFFFQHRWWQSVHVVLYERRVPIAHNGRWKPVRSGLPLFSTVTLNCNDGAVCAIKEMLDNKQEDGGGSEKKDGCDTLVRLKCWRAWEASFSCMKTTERCNAARQKHAHCAWVQPAHFTFSVEGVDYALRTQITRNLCAEAWERASKVSSEARVNAAVERLQTHRIWKWQTQVFKWSAWNLQWGNFYAVKTIK